MKSIAYLVVCLVLLSACSGDIPETKVARRDITEMVFASGILEPDSNYNLTAQTDGYIIELNFKEGDIVSASKILAVIDNKANVITSNSATELLGILNYNATPDAPALKQAEANIAFAKEKMKQDSIQVGRYEKLLQSNSVSKLESENVRISYEASRTNYNVAKQTYASLKLQAEQQLINQRSMANVNSVNKSNNEIRALVSGKVYKKMKQLGDFVRRGEVIAVIGNADNLYARLSIDESSMGKVKVGQEAIVQLNMDKTKNYKGIVTEILPAFDEMTQSFFVKVYFKEALQTKISGVQLQANIIIGSKANVIVIPKPYLDYGNKVIVKGITEPVIVKTGFVSNEWVEIIDGLKEGDVIRLNTKK